MEVLVGVPVFRVPGLVQSCLSSLISTPADVLVIDNAADDDVKTLLRGFGKRVKIITNTENGYCNGGWNQILEYGISHGYDVIGLGSSDVTMHPGWYDAVVKRVQEHPREVFIPSIGEPVPNPDTNNVFVHPNTGWFFSFLPLEAAKLVYPIPRGLKHWYGDNHMYEVLKHHGIGHVLLNEVRCYHQQGGITVKVAEANSVIAQDGIEWERLKNAGTYSNW